MDNEHFLGHQIVICGCYINPSVQVKPWINISDECRQFVNSWLADQFGGEKIPALDNGVVIFANGDAIMNLETRKAISKLRCWEGE